MLAPLSQLMVAGAERTTVLQLVKMPPAICRVPAPVRSNEWLAGMSSRPLSTPPAQVRSPFTARLVFEMRPPVQFRSPLRVNKPPLISPALRLTGPLTVKALEATPPSRFNVPVRVPPLLIVPPRQFTEPSRAHAPLIVPEPSSRGASIEITPERVNSAPLNPSEPAPVTREPSLRVCLPEEKLIPPLCRSRTPRLRSSTEPNSVTFDPVVFRNTPELTKTGAGLFVDVSAALFCTSNRPELVMAAPLPSWKAPRSDQRTLPALSSTPELRNLGLLPARSRCPSGETRMRERTSPLLHVIRPARFRSRPVRRPPLRSNTPLEETMLAEIPLVDNSNVPALTESVCAPVTPPRVRLPTLALAETETV